MSITPAFTRHLTDVFSALFSYVMALRQNLATKQPAYEEVRAEIQRLFKQSESFVTDGFCTQEDYDAARYALCAWIDEALLASSWTYKGRWRIDLLQRLYYQSADAGEKFFQRLKQLEPHQHTVREVYYLCLALGFKGRYCAPDDSYALDQLKERHLKLLFNSVAQVPALAALEKNLLFPEAYAQKPISPVRKARRHEWPILAALAAPAVLLLVLFLSYRFTLYSVGENILKAVRS